MNLQSKEAMMAFFVNRPTAEKQPHLHRLRRPERCTSRTLRATTAEWPSWRELARWRPLAACLLAAATLLVSQPSARAQDSQDPKVWCEGLLNDVVNKDDAAATSQVKNTLLGRSVATTSDNVILAFTQTRSLGGQLKTYDYISEQQVGSRLKRLKYVVYAENYFLVAQFAFYKGDHGWELFGFDANNSAGQVPW